jgi:putative oxygen-independent coproporphyrinogen III oxidase
MREISIYIHFPYCELKCPYCDFNSHVNTDFKEDLHIKSWKNELDFFFRQISQTHLLRSVFFGGGTPSLMKSKSVFEILEYIKKSPYLEVKNPEITLEANPSSAEYRKFKEFKEAGINRLSIGVQSLNKQDLKFLGRKHDENEAKNAILMAREVFENYSFDLIYHLPNQTLEKWQEELEYAVKKYASFHISAYTLTIEKGTKFFKMHEDGIFQLPKQEDEFYDLTNEILLKNSFTRYEISNYAKVGFEALHNLSYWQSIDYIGIGAGAHGRITKNGKRFATQNFSAPEKYLNQALNEGNALQSFEELSKEDIIKETLIMNLRCIAGLDLGFFEAKYGFDLLSCLPQKHLDLMQENGLLEVYKSHIKLTRKGLNVANAIVQKLT